MYLFLSLMLTLLATPVLMWLAHGYGLLDHPDQRKKHQGSIPLVGGLAMSIAIGIGAVWQFGNEDFFWAFFVSTLLVVLVGFIDDWKGLSVTFRFAGQATAVLIVALFTGVQLSQLGNLFGYGLVTLGVLSIPMTVFAVVGMANAINLSDGLDGLAGGLALIATGFLAAAAYLVGMPRELDALLILGGALIGFLFFNMRFPWQQRAKVFMGDSGSLMLGFLLSLAAITLTQNESSSLRPAAVLWFFAFPLLDTVSLMLRRVLKGKNPFHPGRDHLHHILLQVGYSECQVVRFILLCALMFGLVGFIGWRLGVPNRVLFYGFLVIFAIYFAGVQHAWKLMRLIMPLRMKSSD